LRCNELLKLRLCDVAVLAETGADPCDGVNLSLWGTKTGDHKVPFRRIEGDADCVTFIREREVALLAGGAKPTALLFRVEELGFPASAAETAATAILRRWLAAAGVAGPKLALYVCNSLRRGRATDLLDWEIPAVSRQARALEEHGVVHDILPLHAPPRERAGLRRARRGGRPRLRLAVLEAAELSRPPPPHPWFGLVVACGMGLGDSG
jgi:hypothetical protein